MHKLPIIIFFGFCALFATLLLRAGDEKTPSAISKAPFPALTLSSVDGKKAWNTESLKGRVTLINFYASWCTPCAEEMPELAAMKKQFPKVHFEGIAWNDEPTTLQKWLKKNGDPFDSHWLDKNGRATIDLGIKGIPESIIVDEHGLIRYRIAGPITRNVRAKELDTLLITLLNEQQRQAETNRGL